MYIKINDEKIYLNFYNKTANGLLFEFNQDISEETFSNETALDMFSDDDIFLCEYDLSKYTVEINANSLYLKDMSIVKDIDTCKLEKIAMSKQLLADWLVANPMLYSDGNYYTVTEEKQALLNGNLASYERSTKVGIDYSLKWNSTGSECVEWSYNDLLKLSLTIAGYVAPKVSKQQAIELQIKACETVDEVNKIVIDYDE